MRRTLLLAAALVIAYVAYSRFFAGPPGVWPGQGGGAPVSAALVVARSVIQWDTFSGRLAAVDQVDIRPRVSGTIDKIHFKEAQSVKKGDLLFTIDPKPYQAALEAARSAHAYAEGEYKRAQGLLKEKAIARREFDEKANGYKQAHAALTRAELDMGYSAIRAPINGRVSRPEITEGNLVEGGGNAPVLTTIVSADPIYADFDIDEKSYVNYLQAAGDAAKLVDMPVRLFLEGMAAPKAGRIRSFDNRLNPSTGSLRVRAVFANSDGALIPGLFARVEIGRAGEALLISERGLGTDQNRKFVYVVGEDNKAERREITLGGMAEGLRVVTAGLREGERVVIGGLQRVMMPGQAVTPELVSMEDSAEKKESGAPEKPEGAEP